MIELLTLQMPTSKSEKQIVPKFLFLGPEFYIPLKIRMVLISLFYTYSQGCLQNRNSKWGPQFLYSVFQAECNYMK